MCPFFGPGALAGHCGLGEHWTLTGCGTHLEASHTTGTYVVDNTCVMWGWDVSAGGRTAEAVPVAVAIRCQSRPLGRPSDCPAQDTCTGKGSCPGCRGPRPWLSFELVPSSALFSLDPGQRGYFFLLELWCWHSGCASSLPGKTPALGLHHPAPDLS